MTSRFRFVPVALACHVASLASLVGGCAAPVSSVSVVRPVEPRRLVTEPAPLASATPIRSREVVAAATADRPPAAASSVTTNADHAALASLRIEPGPSGPVASHPSRTPAAAAPATTAFGKRDLVTWARRGERDAVVIERIERSAVTPRLTAADEVELRDAGVSEPVIQSVRACARR